MRLDDSRGCGARFLLLLALLLAACGEGAGPGDDLGGDRPDVRDSGPAWDPGTPGEQCGGYGYGYGPDCVPEGSLDCTQDPCIFGQCAIESGQGVCRCDPGYAGRICGECAEGWVVRGLRCVPHDACVDFPCVFGTCRIGNDQPFCDCDEGYTGTNCDECAEGWRPEDLRCVKGEAA